MIRQFMNGICMVLADSVPGVSGGTIAFILGFYDRFIGSINDLIYEKGEKRKEAFIFLVKLGVGWVCGMIAISAMFLPRISGSTLLLIFGLYLPVISGIKEFLHLNLAVFPGLCIFGVGVIAGALSVVKGIKICLDKFRPQTMYTIFGLMVGSLYAIAMGPTTLDVPQDALSIHDFNFVAFIIGIAVVVGLQLMGNKKGKV